MASLNSGLKSWLHHLLHCFCWANYMKSVGIENSCNVCHPEDLWWSWKHYQGRWMRIQFSSKCRPSYVALGKAFFGVKLVGFSTNSAGAHIEECPVWNHKLVPCTEALQTSHCLLCGPVQTLVLQHLHAAKSWFCDTLEPEWGTSAAPRARRITPRTASLLLGKQYSK